VTQIILKDQELVTQVASPLVLNLETAVTRSLPGVDQRSDLHIRSVGIAVEHRDAEVVSCGVDLMIEMRAQAVCGRGSAKSV
jgi:hypothetical protein